MSENLKEPGTGTQKVYGRNMEGTEIIQGHNKMRYREQNNKNNRNQEIFEVGPDHNGKQGRVGSSLYRAQVGLPRVLGFLGSWVFGFSGFQVFWELQGRARVSEIAEMPQEIDWEALGSLGKCLGASGSAREPWKGYRTFLSLVSNVLRVLQDVT